MPYAIWDKGLSEMPVIIPDDSIIDLFSHTVTPLLEEITYLSEENNQLQQIRDSLLPKLMSGRIRVNIGG